MLQYLTPPQANQYTLVQTIHLKFEEKNVSKIFKLQHHDTNKTYLITSFNMH